MSLVSKLFVLFMACQAAMGFVVQQQTSPSTKVLLHATTPGHEQQPSTESFPNKIAKALTATAVMVSTSPLMALAEEDYEYGAVDAPIGIAVGGGILAILTAGVPLLMQGGEEAFEEMKERDSNKWGKGGV